MSDLSVLSGSYQFGLGLHVRSCTFHPKFAEICLPNPLDRGTPGPYPLCMTYEMAEMQTEFDFDFTGPSDADWAWYLEESYVDPAEMIYSWEG